MKSRSTGAHFVSARDSARQTLQEQIGSSTVTMYLDMRYKMRAARLIECRRVEGRAVIAGVSLTVTLLDDGRIAVTGTGDAINAVFGKLSGTDGSGLPSGRSRDMTNSDHIAKIVTAVRLYFPEGCAPSEGGEHIDFGAIVRASGLTREEVMASVGTKLARALGVQRATYKHDRSGRNWGLLRLV